MHGNLNERQWTNEDVELRERKAQDEARQSFWAYRQYLNYPRLIASPWQRQVALELHRFWNQYCTGRRPKLLLQAPRQHGKSVMVTDFLSWIAGQRRDIKIIFSSFSDRLGLRANLRLQRIFASPRFLGTFGGSILQGGMLQNSKIIEFAGGEGFFRNTTVAGPVTGEGLDIGVIDDPIKGRAEASSEVVREKTWNWLTDDFLPCFADDGAMLMIMTRWHLDDPAGRMMEQYPSVRVCRYAAIAENDEVHEKLDDKPPFMRRAGDPLFPELKSLQFLQNQRSIMTLAGWQSVYQQSPILVGGGMFPLDKIQIIPELPAAANVSATVRYWDKAGTEEGGAYTAGVLMSRMRDGTFVVIDVRRGQWSALQREQMIKQTAAVDRGLYPFAKIVVEQEPGSGGKESAEATVRMLAGYPVEADKVTGDKEVRADPFAAQWQAGNIRLISAPWNRAYLDEHEHFPVGKFKDQVDASSGAFNKIANKYRYPSSASWIS